MLIVEVGDAPLIKLAYPGETQFFSTASARSHTDAAGGWRVVSAQSLPALRRALADPALSLIVVHAFRHAPWQARTLMRALGHRRVLRGDLPFLRRLGPYLIGRPRAPLAVLDMDDPPLIPRHNFALWDASTLYFKRELPSDRWRTVMTTGHFDLPTPRMRRLPRWRIRMAKLRPISLGLPLGAEADLAGVPSEPEKTSDLFCAGSVEASSTARERGWLEILALKDAGVRVDVPTHRLPRAEFYERASHAWLTWSPEGLGYDCFRHYEAAACGSLPLINQPVIERHAPLLADVHAVYYDVEPGGLTRAVQAALAAPDRLRQMSLAARAHVRAHHTSDAIARYVVETTLDMWRG